MGESNRKQDLLRESGKDYKKVTDKNKYGIQDSIDGGIVCDCRHDANRMLGGREDG